MKINIEFGQASIMLTTTINVSRVPCIGEFIYFPNSGDDAYYEVKEVYHSAECTRHTNAAIVRVVGHNEIIQEKKDE